jgi:hypothetical protein
VLSIDTKTAAAFDSYCAQLRFLWTFDERVVTASLRCFGLAAARGAAVTDRASEVQGFVEFMGDKIPLAVLICIRNMTANPMCPTDQRFIVVQQFCGTFCHAITSLAAIGSPEDLMTAGRVLTHLFQRLSRTELTTLSEEEDFWRLLTHVLACEHTPLAVFMDCVALLKDCRSVNSRPQNRQDLCVALDHACRRAEYPADELRCWLLNE